MSMKSTITKSETLVSSETGSAAKQTRMIIEIIQFLFIFKFFSIRPVNIIVLLLILFKIFIKILVLPV